MSQRTLTAPPVAPRPPASGRQRHTTTGGALPLLLVSPAGAVLVLLTGVPLLFLVGASFTDYGQRALFTGEFAFVGVAQYADILSDDAFWWSLARTVLFTAAMVAGSVLIGMAVAQLLVRLGRRMRLAVTVVLITAWAMPNVASSLVWNWLFQPGYGVVNWMLTTVGAGDFSDTNWAASAPLALTAIWLLIVWQAVPFIALTLHAAQTQIDAGMLESARIDGAGEWRVYWTLVVPFLKPTLGLMILLSTIWDFNVFNQIWLVSRGGPDDATATLGVYAYQQAFVGFDLGGGAAISVVTTVLLMLLTALYIRSLLRAGEDL